MNKVSLEQALDRIAVRAARIRRLIDRQRAAVTRLEKAGRFPEARRLLQLSEDLQALQHVRRTRLLDQLFVLTVTLLRAH